MGESYYVFADMLPPERPGSISVPNVLAAAAIAVAFLFVGKLGQSAPAMILVIMTAALAGWGVFALKTRIASKSD